jgi:hypothetical protein
MLFLRGFFFRLFNFDISLCFLDLSLELVYLLSQIFNLSLTSLGLILHFSYSIPDGLGFPLYQSDLLGQLVYLAPGLPDLALLATDVPQDVWSSSLYIQPLAFEFSDLGFETLSFILILGWVELSC